MPKDFTKNMKEYDLNNYKHLGIANNKKTTIIICFSHDFKFKKEDQSMSI